MAKEKAKAKDYLSDDILKTVFSQPEIYRPYLSVRHFKAGAFLNVDNLMDVLYIFMTGRFNVYGLQSDGSQFLFRSCEAVMLIGENDFIIRASDDLHNLYEMAFSLEMLTDCTVIALDYRRIMPMLLKDARFLYTMCHSLVEKTLHFGRLEMNSALQSAEARVAQFLLSEQKSGKVIKGNQSIWAEQLRMSYRHLHRVLKRFVEDGAIVRESGGYRVADPEKLKEVL